MKIKNRRLEYIGFILPLLLAVICLISVTTDHHQALLPIPMPQEFIGEYSYDDETWQPLTEEADLSALKGDLYLRGTFLREMAEGWQLNFYRNHIGVQIAVNGQQIYQDDILEFPDLKPELFASICARSWTGTLVPAIGPEDTAVLTEIGEWMAVNSEAIYGTKVWRKYGEGPTKVKEGQFTDGVEKVFTPEDIRFTVKGENLYCTVLSWPEDGHVVIKSLGHSTDANLPEFHGIVKDVDVLGCDMKPVWERKQGGLHVTLPGIKTDKPVVVRVKID